MIADHQTNTVYLADACLFLEGNDFAGFRKFLAKQGVKVKLLDLTNDYFCRDYMPVQVSEKDFVQFIFRPGRYFDISEHDLISNPAKIELENKLVQPKYSSLILDGGNVVKWTDKVIVTDRVIKDNRYWFSSDDAVIRQLENDLQCKVIIIPEYPGDNTGHADGLVRFADADTVLVNDPETEPKRSWLKEFLTVLSANGLRHIPLPCTVEDRQDTAIGLYINYLHASDLVVVPQFGIREDPQAMEIMQQVFGSANRVVPFTANWIAEYSGVFNCVSWTVVE